MENLWSVHVESRRTCRFSGLLTAWPVKSRMRRENIVVASSGMSRSTLYRDNVRRTRLTTYSNL
jgi:hypothetical protein